MKYSTDCNCENMKREKVSQIIRIAGQDILVENAPARVCQDCGEIHFEGRFLINLEKKLKRQQKQVA